jgi:hypothetical protein
MGRNEIVFAVRLQAYGNQGCRSGDEPVQHDRNASRCRAKYQSGQPTDF